MVAVCQHRADDVFRVAVLLQDFGAESRVVFGGRTNLPVKVVEQPGDSPPVFIFPELSGVPLMDASTEGRCFISMFVLPCRFKNSIVCDLSITPIFSYLTGHHLRPGYHP